MKKCLKRLTAITMAVVMLLAGSATTFAAGSDSLQSIPNDISGNIYFDEYTDSGIMLATDYLVNQTVSGLALNKTYSTSFTMPSDGYLVVKLAVSGSASIKVKLSI